MARRAPRRPAAVAEEAIGFVGFFGVVFLVVTMFCEFTGRPALGWALTLLACVLLLVALDAWRIRLVRTGARATAGGSGPVAGGAAAAGRAPAVARAPTGHGPDATPGRHG